MFTGKPFKITENLKERRTWSEVFQALNENNFRHRILYPAKVSFKIDGGIKVLHEKQKLKQYLTTKPPTQKILQEVLHSEDESKQTMRRREALSHRRRKNK
jgi:hypothetical protein